MVEGCVVPVRRIMALLAGRRIAAGQMIGIRCTVVIRRMAREAFRRFIAVGATIVTLHATDSEMRSRERESGSIVVKLRIPIRSCVTIVARRREACVSVIRIRCIIEVIRVTGGTCRWGSRILTADMALQTRRLNMRTRQRESTQIMIECRIMPIGGGVALRAIRAET